jgi:hypothetical protein
VLLQLISVSFDLLNIASKLQLGRSHDQGNKYGAAVTRTQGRHMYCSHIEKEMQAE